MTLGQRDETYLEGAPHHTATSALGMDRVQPAASLRFICGVAVVACLMAAVPQNGWSQWDAYQPTRLDTLLTAMEQSIDRGGAVEYRRRCIRHVDRGTDAGDADSGEVHRGDTFDTAHLPVHAALLVALRRSGLQLRRPVFALGSVWYHCRRSLASRAVEASGVHAGRIFEVRSPRALRGLSSAPLPPGAARSDG